MRPDQAEKLEAIIDRLADVFIVEADPANWTADGVMPRDMTQAQRGDRHWDRKGAVGTAGVLNHALNLHKHWRERAALSPSGELPADEAEDLDQTIRKAERRAEQIASKAVEKAMQRRNKGAREPVSKS
jgi:hypothetical protein